MTFRPRREVDGADETQEASGSSDDYRGRMISRLSSKPTSLPFGRAASTGAREGRAFSSDPEHLFFLFRDRPVQIAEGSLEGVERHAGFSSDFTNC